MLSATTAFGKTVTAIGLIAKHSVNTLILVHTKALLDQWVQRIKQFLVIYDAPEVEEGKRKPKKCLSPIGTLSSTGNKLHGISFVLPFVSDLSQCKRSVVISCPKVRIGRLSQIAERLIDLAANGTEIVLYTREENDDTLRFQHQGITVITIHQLSLHAAIIDKSTLWYGSVNILGYHSDEDNLIRFKNPEIASNLLDSIKNNH